MSVTKSQKAENTSKFPQHFIPANESAWFIKVFTLYTKSLFRIRFKHVWIKNNYHPNSQARTIFFLNHTSWWDGLIPVFLASVLSLKNARALMEDLQMKRYGFFKKLGAFSVNPDSPSSTIRTLRYALKSLEKSNANLFIYPEGRISPFSTEKPDFKKGIVWLSKHAPEVNLVPAGIYIHSMRSSRPELHIQLGFPVAPDVQGRQPVTGRISESFRVSLKNSRSENPAEVLHAGKQAGISPSKKDRVTVVGDSKENACKLKLEKAMQKQLKDLEKYSGTEDSYFRKYF